MQNNYLSTGNIVVFALVILLTLLSVLYGNMRSRSVTEKDTLIDYLIMGRRLTLPLFIFSLVSTWYGGIFGVTQISFESGVYNFVTQGFFWYITYIFFALFLVSKIKKYNAVTLPNLVEKMFGPKSAKLAAIFNLFNVIPIAYTISIGLLIDMMTGYGFLTSMIIGISFVMAYSMFGGFRAVVFSDIIQFFVMFVSVLLVVVFSFSKYGGIDYLVDALPETHFSLTGKHSLATTLVWGFISLSTLVDPNFYQRCFAAKDTTTAKKGILISTLIWFVFDIFTTLGGMYARAAMPYASSQYAYMNYSLELLPNFLQGFFLAGITATIISTLDSYLFLSGTTITYDLLPKRLRNKIWLHRLSILFIGFLSVSLALAFDGNIKKVWKILGSYSASCLLLPVLIGHIFPKLLSDLQFTISCLTGVAFTTFWIVIEKSGFYANIDELYIGMLSTLCALIILKSLEKRSAT